MSGFAWRPWKNAAKNERDCDECRNGGTNCSQENGYPAIPFGTIIAHGEAGRQMGGIDGYLTEVIA